MPPTITSFLSKVKITGKKLTCDCCNERDPGKALENLENDTQGGTIIGKKDYANVFKYREKSGKGLQWSGTAGLKEE